MRKAPTVKSSRCKNLAAALSSGSGSSSASAKRVRGASDSSLLPHEAMCGVSNSSSAVDGRSEGSACKQ